MKLALGRVSLMQVCVIYESKLLMYLLEPPSSDQGLETLKADASESGASLSTGTSPSPFPSSFINLIQSPGFSLFLPVLSVRSRENSRIREIKGERSVTQTRHKIPVSISRMSTATASSIHYSMNWKTSYV